MDWRCILFIVKCLEAYYPESLNVMLIHNGELSSFILLTLQLGR